MIEEKMAVPIADIIPENGKYLKTNKMSLRT